MLGNFFKKIVKGVGDIISGIVGGIVKLVTNVVDGFLGAFGFSFDLPEYDNPSSFESENQGILLNTASAVKGIPVVYGERRIGGTRVFMGNSGPSNDNKYLYIVLAICEGEIDGFTELYINDEKQGLSSYTGDKITPNQALTITQQNLQGEESSYWRSNRSLVVAEFRTGAEDQTSSTFFQGEQGGSWTANHRLRGVAYVALRFEWFPENNPWQGIPQVQVKVRGKKVLTTYTSAMDTDSDTSTYEAQSQITGVGAFTYSNNPADCLLDYLRNPRYGKGLKDNRINFASFDTQQAVFEQTYSLTTQPFVSFLFRCDAVVNTEETMFNNTKRLLQSCRGFLPYVNGKYQLRFEANFPADDAIAITDDMIIGDINIQSADKNSKYNEARITFANEQKGYDSDTVIYQDSTALSEDGGEPLILTLSHPTLTRWERVYFFAKYMVDRSRHQLAVSLKITNEGQSIVAGDVVKINHQYKTTTTGTDLTDYLFKSPTDSTGTVDPTAPEMLFRVVSTKLNYDNTVDLQLLEHRNVMYGITAINRDDFQQCPPGYVFDTTLNRCVTDGSKGLPECPEGYHYDYDQQICVQDDNNNCPSGYHWDPAQNKCVLDNVGGTSSVKASAVVNNGLGYVTWNIDVSAIRPNGDAIIEIWYALNSSAKDFSKIQQHFRTLAGATQYSFTATTVKGVPIRPGDYVSYQVYMAPATLTADFSRIRIDGGENQPGGVSYVIIPADTTTSTTAAVVGSSSLATQGFDS